METTSLWAEWEEVQMWMAAAHPVFLRLYVELFSNPGQGMDGFGQHWRVHAHAHAHMHGRGRETVSAVTIENSVLYA